MWTTTHTKKIITENLNESTMWFLLINMSCQILYAANVTTRVAVKLCQYNILSTCATEQYIDASR